MPNHPFTRRRLITDAARLASLTAASALMPPNVQKLLAAPPRAGSLKDVKHVVMLMQENRSFDHYFGTLAGVRGFDDPEALTLPNGKSVFHQPDAAHPDGELLPFHLNTAATNAQKLPSTSHAWKVQHQAWNGGKMDEWLSAHRAADGDNGPYVMGYLKRADIPFHYALADAFTICDQYFCSVLGPTWPNRLYWMTGTIDPEGKSGGPSLSTGKLPPAGAFTWRTYAEELEEAGVPWGIYQYGAPGGHEHNLFKVFRQFKFAAPTDPLFIKGMADSDPEKFKNDVLNDRLPTISWMFPNEEANEHPNHLPAAGAAFIAERINELAANPDVWAKTAFIINYDENDGLFDHVPPPVPPVGTPGEFVLDLPIGGGFRVPCIIVSPWTVGGWVCSQNFDHTSVLQFCEKVTGVKASNITGWRRQTFGDLTGTFRFDHPATAPSLPGGTKARLNAVLGSVDRLPAPTIPSGTAQSLPVQEKGSRKRLR